MSYYKLPAIILYKYINSYRSYKEHAIMVMIILCMFILGDRFKKAKIACF